MSETFSEELFLQMITPTKDNLIPAGGFFFFDGIHTRLWERVKRRWDKFVSSPEDWNKRKRYLDLVRRVGHPLFIEDYLSFLQNHPNIPPLSPDQQEEEAKMLVEAYMNMAEGARRRMLGWLSCGEYRSAEMMKQDALDYLKKSLEFQKKLPNPTPIKTI